MPATFVVGPGEVSMRPMLDNPQDLERHVLPMVRRYNEKEATRLERMELREAKANLEVVQSAQYDDQRFRSTMITIAAFEIRSIAERIVQLRDQNVKYVVLPVWGQEGKFALFPEYNNTFTDHGVWFFDRLKGKSDQEIAEFLDAENLMTDASKTYFTEAFFVCNGRDGEALRKLQASRGSRIVDALRLCNDEQHDARDDLIRLRRKEWRTLLLEFWKSEHALDSTTPWLEALHWREKKMYKNLSEDDKISFLCLPKIVRMWRVMSPSEKNWIAMHSAYIFPILDREIPKLTPAQEEAMNNTKWRIVGHSGIIPRVADDENLDKEVLFLKKLMRGMLEKWRGESPWLFTSNHVEPAVSAVPIVPVTPVESTNSAELVTPVESSELANTAEPVQPLSRKNRRAAVNSAKLDAELASMSHRKK